MGVGQVLTIPISGMMTGWTALSRQPDAIGSSIPHASTFVPGATYRVLTFGDGKYGQYAVVRAGGHLDSEFFPESMFRRSFSGTPSYATFLTQREVDYVVVDKRYKRFRTNEEALLRSMAASGGRECVDGVSVREVEEQPNFAVFHVSRGCATPAPTR